MNALNDGAGRIAAAPARVTAGPAVRAVVIHGGEGTGLEIERLPFPGLLATGDRRAGMRSFIENGPGKATFTGR